jgi:hypothetical protein
MNACILFLDMTRLRYIPTASDALHFRRIKPYHASDIIARDVHRQLPTPGMRAFRGGFSCYIFGEKYIIDFSVDLYIISACDPLQRIRWN